MTPYLHLYRQQQIQHEVEQASPVQLVVLLYDRAIALLRLAQGRLTKEDMSKKGEALLKAVDILSELQAVLNLEEGGEIAIQLDRLYSYMIHELTRANLSNDPLPLGASIKILEELRLGWRQVAELNPNKGILSLGERPHEQAV